ncbi:hypothetical protein [Streptomyces vinaceus]|uniref:hypothetical protein n=1 Tax=Streptomyces vinaceus TaxID=1960 RepID=UPI003807F72C
MAQRTEYDEAQAAKRLHTTVVVLRWARHVGVVPDPDVRGFAWSRSAVEAMDAAAVRASMPREAVSPYEAANRIAQHWVRRTSPASRQRCPAMQWSA